MEERVLHWEGCLNARDLGGLGTGRVRWGAIARSDDPARLTAAGWSAVLAHGVRTIVDLTGTDERLPDTAPRPAELTTVHLPLDAPADTGFWDRWGGALSCTPLYYRAFLAHFPRRTCAVLSAIADAGLGGVLVHCGGGRDRTGLIVLLLLAIAGVDADEIADDYALSHARRPEQMARIGLDDDTPRIRQLRAAHGTTEREVIRRTVGFARRGGAPARGRPHR